MAIQPTQPQGIGGVLDTSFQLYKESIGTVWPLSLLLAIAGSAPTLYALITGPGSGDNARIGSSLTLFIVFTVLSVVLSLWFMGAIYLKQHAIGVGEEISAGEAVQAALGRLGSLVGMMVLFSLALMGGLLLLIIPGVILIVSLMLSTNVLLVEGKGAVESLTTSHKLVWGNWWRSFALLTIVGILIVVLFVAVGIVFGVAAPFIGLSVDDAVVIALMSDLVLNAINNLLFMPFFTAALIALYWDLKLRKEGGDLAARVDALNAT